MFRVWCPLAYFYDVLKVLHVLNVSGIMPSKVLRTVDATDHAVYPSGRVQGLKPAL